MEYLTRKYQLVRARH
ncbi:hypothetical protein ACVXHB_28595 [Escherichia coli]